MSRAARFTSSERRRLAWFGAVVIALHAVGFYLLLELVAPRHLELGGGGAFGLGLGITAYALGLRHAFDADHIAAIDNATRELMADGGRPLGSASSTRSGTAPWCSRSRCCSPRACARSPDRCGTGTPRCTA